jgi:4-hydroxymandelate oxidase
MFGTRRDVLRSTVALIGAAGFPAQGVHAQQGPSSTGESKLTDSVSVSDLERLARERMSHMAFEYMAGGAGDEITLRWNQEALQHLRLRPRVLNDVSAVDTRVTLLGQEHPYPILLAPTAYHRLMHPEGELATARAAGSRGTTLIVSSSTTTAIEDIARVATAPLWFQLYLQPERSVTVDVVRRVEAAGCRVLCVTVDAPVSGPQNRIRRAAFVLPPDLELPMNPLANRRRRETAPPDTEMEPFAARYPATWKDIEWLQSLTRLPVVLKGILHPDDAEKAASAGVAAIVVSNHGARNLDTAPATIEVLPEIVDRVAGRVPVLVDGGIRRGTDVLKALALGASATLIGRAYLYGLGADGERGVTRVLDILRTELEMAMALTGQANMAALDRRLVFSPSGCASPR